MPDDLDDLFEAVDIEEAIVSAKEQIVSDVAEGFQTVIVDGTTVSMSDPLRRLEALEKLERRRVVNPFGGFRHYQIVPPGGRS